MADIQSFVRNPLGIFGSRNVGGGATQTYSAFGPANTTTGPEDLPVPTPGSDADIDPRALYYSDRSKELEFRERYFTGQQHEMKSFDQGGRYRTPGVEAWATPPVMGGMAPDFYVPLEQRRPGTPKRLGRTIVRRFTSMLFGAHRFPQLRSTDRETQTFAKTLAEASSMKARWCEARNMAGSCGTAGISWCFYDGRLIVRPHLGRLIHPIEWVDFDSKEVAHVVELYRHDLVIPDDKGVHKNVPHWYRRDWTLDEDIVYKPARADRPGPVAWERDERSCNRHGDGFCHFEWLTNETDLEPDGVDGQPDYPDQYNALDSLDLTISTVVYGGQKNLDPTLLLGLDKSDLAGAVLRKGSDNAIALGGKNSPSGGGTATYLELAGSSITAGLALFEAQKREILEDCQCVIADPDKIAAAGVSGAAIELLFQPMLSVEDEHRGNYGSRYVRMMDKVLRAARRLLAPPMPAYEVDVAGDEAPAPIPENLPDANSSLREPGVEPPLDATAPEPEPPPVYFLRLEPQMVDGVLRDLTPGAGSLSAVWGEYFPPTIADKGQAATAFGAANGARPTISHRTSVEAMANILDLDQDEEWARVEADERQRAARELGMTPGIGGDVPDPNAPPSINDPSRTAEDDHPEGLLTDTDMAGVITVNEARVSAGLGPLRTPQGSLDPDGNLTVAEFVAKREAKGEAQGEVQGGGPKPVAAPSVAPKASPPMPPKVSPPRP